MSQFNYADYQKVIEKAQSGGSNAVKVGFFKLKDDGDQALARINCSSVEDLDFASVHTISAGGKWLKVSCLNPLGTYGDHCALCAANAAGNKAISKASKKVYLQMLVSYKDNITGKFTPAAPVVWERPAAFSRDIANLIKAYKDAGIDLKNVLITITRNGKAGDMKTTYSLMPAPEAIFKPEMIPADFSAFNNFNIARHSYWEKTPDEINAFLMTGAFPETNAAATPSTNTAAYQVPNAAPSAAFSTAQPVTPVNAFAGNNVSYNAPVSATINPATPAFTPVVNPGMPIPTIQPTPVAAPSSASVAAPTASVAPAVTPTTNTAEPTVRRVRDFNGYSF